MWCVQTPGHELKVIPRIPRREAARVEVEQEGPWAVVMLCKTVDLLHGPGECGCITFCMTPSGIEAREMVEKLRTQPERQLVDDIKEQWAHET